MKQKILFLLVSLMILFGCGQRTTMKYAIDTEYTLWQVDSVCVVEGIPPLSDYDTLWISNIYFDDSTRIGYYEYCYIKDDKVVYTVASLDSLYNFKKRIIEDIK